MPPHMFPGAAAVRSSGTCRALLAGLRCAGVLWPLLPAAPGRAHDDPDPDSDDEEIGDHLPGDHQLRRLGLGVISPNPTVENAVTVKYSAPVLVSGSVKLLAECVAMTT
jgi:hypothetical protein